MRPPPRAPWGPSGRRRLSLERRAVAGLGRFRRVEAAVRSGRGIRSTAVPFPPPRRSAQPYAVDSGRLSRPRRRRTPMSERLEQPHGSGPRTARRRTRRSRSGRVWGARTIPAATARQLAAESEPNLFGLPAEIVEEDDGTPSADDPERDLLPADLGLVALRRADRFGAGALVLAGVAANVSLSLSWSPGEGPSGIWLVQRGVEGLGGGAWALGSIWQPFVVVLCGGLLV